MEMKTYVSIRVTKYEEQQAVLAKFPDAYFVQRGENIIDFFLPSFRESEVQEFITEYNRKYLKSWKQNLKEKKDA